MTETVEEAKTIIGVSRIVVETKNIAIYNKNDLKQYILSKIKPKYNINKKMLLLKMDCSLKPLFKAYGFNNITHNDFVLIIRHKIDELNIKADSEHSSVNLTFYNLESLYDFIEFVSKYILGEN